jgi:Ca2+-binding RTX toxin-like protein
MRGKFGILACGVLCSVAVLVLPTVAGAAGFGGPGYAGTSGPPTTSKPESKLWFNDGFWWASMYSKTQEAYTIHRLNMRTQRWVNTGVEIDDRESTRQDVLRIGNVLLVASHKYNPNPGHDDTPDQLNDGMFLYRFTYNGTSYGNRLARAIDPQRAEALTIAADSNGAIWATWVQRTSSSGVRQVYVKKTGDTCAGSGGNNCDFGGVVVLDPEVGYDDISSIVQFAGNRIGVLWSDTPDTSTTGSNTDSVMEFAVHVDGADPATWSVQPATNSTIPKLAEDHINLKAAGNTVYAAVKTKFSSAANPGIRLLVRSSSGNWSGHEVTNAGFNHTRPIVVITGSRVRVFSQRGPDDSADVFMKTASRSTLNFPGGAGVKVLDAGNPTSTKQNLTGTTQMIVVGTDGGAAKRYRHMYTQLSTCVRTGTVGNDRICGNRLNNRLNGLAGNDVILGGRGNDRIVGGSGRDRLFGGPGRDTFITRDGARDVLKGGSGRDRARVDRLDVRRSIASLF